MGFDVDCSSVTKEGNSPCVRIYKLLHNLVESVGTLCNDAQLELGECIGHKVLSSSTVKKIFTVNQKKGKIFLINRKDNHSRAESG